MKRLIGLMILLTGCSSVPSLTPKYDNETLLMSVMSGDADTVTVETVLYREDESGDISNEMMLPTFELKNGSSACSRMIFDDSTSDISLLNIDSGGERVSIPVDIGLTQTISVTRVSGSHRSRVSGVIVINQVGNNPVALGFDRTLTIGEQQAIPVTLKNTLTLSPASVQQLKTCLN